MTSQKQDLLQWDDACRAFNNQEYNQSLVLFKPIAISAKIYFNMAICYINMNQLDKALVSLATATKRDPFFALAHFIRGIIYFKMNLFAKALTDFTNVLKNMRSALVIDYTQLGLSRKLFAFEALFNRGLCHSALGNQTASLSDYDEADLIHPTSAGFGDRPLLESKIDQACDLGSRALHSISLYEMDYELAIFKPNEQKVLNAQKVDYIGSPTVIASRNEIDAYAGFSGTLMKVQKQLVNKGPMEGSLIEFGRAATLKRSLTVATVRDQTENKEIQSMDVATKLIPIKTAIKQQFKPLIESRSSSLSL